MQPLIITVQENETVLDDTPDKFGIKAVIIASISHFAFLVIAPAFYNDSILQMKVHNYWEAIGVVAAHKAGINPEALRRGGIDNIKCHWPPSSPVTSRVPSSSVLVDRACSS